MVGGDRRACAPRRQYIAPNMAKPRKSKKSSQRGGGGGNQAEKHLTIAPNSEMLPMIILKLAPNPCYMTDEIFEYRRSLRIAASSIIDVAVAGAAHGMTRGAAAAREIIDIKRNIRHRAVNGAY